MSTGDVYVGNSIVPGHLRIGGRVSEVECKSHVQRPTNINNLHDLTDPCVAQKQVRLPRMVCNLEPPPCSTVLDLDCGGAV